MRHTTLGNTGMKISVLGFGAMRLPSLPGGKADLENAVPLIRRGLDLGINYIDSAYVYHEGTSEVVVGQAIKGYDRSQVYIATKIRVEKEEDARADIWRAKFEESLRRLDVSYVDVMQIHGLKWEQYAGHAARPGMAVELLHRLKDEGLVRHIGFSSHDDPANIIKLIETGHFESILVQYNYLDRHNEPAIAAAAEHGMGVIVMGPVGGGRLITGKRVDGPLNGGGGSTARLALRFVWSNPAVSLALSGMGALAQVEENAAVAGEPMEMGEGERFQVAQLAGEAQALVELYCTGCGYCLPCPNGVNIPENFRYLNWLRVWGLDQQARDAYARLTGADVDTTWAGRISGHNAAACLACGECEPKCPQGIAIADRLAEAAEALQR